MLQFRYGIPQRCGRMVGGIELRLRRHQWLLSKAGAQMKDKESDIAISVDEPKRC